VSDDGWSEPHRCEACGFVGAFRYAGGDAWACEACGVRARLSSTERALKDLARTEPAAARDDASRETG
jgi:ribosomal protein L37AE/L43A